MGRKRENREKAKWGPEERKEEAKGRKASPYAHYAHCAR